MLFVSGQEAEEEGRCRLMLFVHAGLSGPDLPVTGDQSSGMLGGR